MIGRLVVFLPVVLLLVLIPGANNLLVLRTASEIGTRAARAVTAGTSAGIAIWSAAVACGVGRFLAAHPDALSTLKVLGSWALIAMGTWAVLSRGAARSPAPSSTGFLPGLLVCLSNPRTPLTAISLLPQYSLADASTTSTLALGAEWAMLAGGWNLLCVRVAHDRLDASQARILARGGGLVVLTLGVLGLLARRTWLA